jgi:hypothetical protein
MNVSNTPKTILEHLSISRKQKKEEADQNKMLRHNMFNSV